MASPYVSKEKTTILLNTIRQFQSRLLRQQMIRKRTGPRITKYPSTSTTSNHGEGKAFVNRFSNTPPRPAICNVLPAGKPLLVLSSLFPSERWTSSLQSVVAPSQFTMGFNVGSNDM